MSRRLVAALAALAVFAAVAVAAGGSLRTSSASYSSATRNTATVRAAADWTPPTVTLRAPTAAVHGTVTLTADAADTETPIASVTLQHRREGTAWVTLCTATAAPVSCAWDTTKVADGGVELRAVATDRSGLSATSATVTTTVANTVTVTLVDPGDIVRGTVPLTAALSGPAAAGGWSVRFEYAVADSTSWKTLCTDSAAPYTCSWSTTGVAAQEYDLRAVAVSGSTTHVSAVLADVLVDNAAPTVTMVNPGSPLRGTVRFTGDADDEDSGVAQVVIQYAATGSSTFKELCVVADEPFSCAYRTTALADGSYGFRAIATDQAGNATTSATVANRVVDNTVASVSVDDPGVHLRGRVTVTASATSTAGITSVRIQRAVTGTTTWADLCTDTTDPYSCVWDTGTVADGGYDLRAVMVDNQERVTTSATLSGRQVDNSARPATDVQTTNGGAAGRLDGGDTITLTYGDRLDPSSVLTGWTGAPVPVTVRLRDGRLVGSNNRGDRLDVQHSGTVLPLGSVALWHNYIGVRRTATFAATMTAATTSVEGVEATTVTIQVGDRVSGVTRTVRSASTMVWTPSAAALDLAGRAFSAAPVTESGTADREF